MGHGIRYFLFSDAFNKREFSYLFIFGFIANLALPPFGLFPILAVSTAILLSSIEKTKSMRQAFLKGWIFGIGFFTGGVYWFTVAFLELMKEIYWFIPMATIGIPVYLGFFFGIASLFCYPFRRYPVLLSFAFSISLFWVEYFRGHGFVNFPWNLWGYSFYRIQSLFQLLSIVGIYGVTLFSAVLSTMLYLFLKREDCVGTVSTAYIIFAIAIGVFVFGKIQLSVHPTKYYEDSAIQILQPNIAQSDKEKDELSDAVFMSHIQLAKSDLLNPLKSYLSVWPETVFGMMPGTRLDYFNQIAGTLPNQWSYAIVGIYDTYPYDQNKVRVYNSLIAVDKNGKIKARHNKYALTPWGESIPYEKISREIFSEESLNELNLITSGYGPTTFNLNGIKEFSPAICYEATFPGRIVPKDKRAEFIVLSGNEDWTIKTTEPYQSLVQASSRAIEEGVPVIKSSNSGLSALIDSNGRILRMLGLQERGTIVSSLPKSNSPTLYSRYRDYPLLVFAVIATLLCLYFLAKHEKAEQKLIER